MNQTQIKEENMIINVLKGAGISLLMTVILLIVFSLLLTYTNIQENVINPVIIMITAVSILIGCSIGIGKMKKDGLINGAIVGVVYMIVIYLISSILNWKFKLNIQSIIMIGIGIAFGILGGIIGVNRK